MNLKIIKTHILFAIVIILTIIFIVSQIMEYEGLSNYTRSLVIPLATVFYMVRIKDRNFYFSAFLWTFSLSELMGLWVETLPLDLTYYLGNSLYILAYIFLVLEVLASIKRSPDYKGFFTKYALHMAVLAMFAIYLVKVLADIQGPIMNRIEYAMEMAYNSIIMFLLTVSLLNFICNDTKKSLIMFLGSICIVFSEIVQVAYFYLANTYVLGIVYSFLLILAFYFFYRHGFLKKESNKNLNLFKP